MFCFQEATLSTRLELEVLEVLTFSELPLLKAQCSSLRMARLQASSLHKRPSYALPCLELWRLELQLDDDKHPPFVTQLPLRAPSPSQNLYKNSVHPLEYFTATCTMSRRYDQRVSYNPHETQSLYTLLTTWTDHHLLPGRSSIPSRICTGGYFPCRHRPGHTSKGWHCLSC